MALGLELGLALALLTGVTTDEVVTVGLDDALDVTTGFIFSVTVICGEAGEAESGSFVAGGSIGDSAIAYRIYVR